MVLIENTFNDVQTSILMVTMSYPRWANEILAYLRMMEKRLGRLERDMVKIKKKLLIPITEPVSTPDSSKSDE